MENTPGTISIDQVRHFYSTIGEAGAHTEMSVVYCKADGSIGKKERCVKGGGKRSGNRPSNNIEYSLKVYGLLLFRNLATGKEFDICLRRLITFNGLRVCH
jgi:hypothetical protein